jgi:hypothetical protein
MTAAFESAWCSERGTRYGYGERPHERWLQSFTFAAPADGLALVIRGSGGGSQQATFRNTLEAYVHAAVANWRQGLPGTVTQRLADLRLELQRQFVEATEPFFADHFQAYWAAVLTDGNRWAHTVLGLQRVYGFDGSTLRRLSVDQVVPIPHMLIECAHLGLPIGTGEFDLHASAIRELEGPPPALLLLVSGLAGKPQLTDEGLETLVRQAVTSGGGLEGAAARLFELVTHAGPDERHQWFRHGAVLFVRPAGASPPRTSG